MEGSFSKSPRLPGIIKTKKGKGEKGLYGVPGRYLVLSGMARLPGCSSAPHDVEQDGATGKVHAWRWAVMSCLVLWENKSQARCRQRAGRWADNGWDVEMAGSVAPLRIHM